MESHQWLEREIGVGDLVLHSGEVLLNASLKILQRGAPNALKDNIVLLPMYYGGAMSGNLPLACGDSPLADPRWCVLIPAMLGGGESTSPSNAHGRQRGAGFPAIHLTDQIEAQRRLLALLYGDVRLALVAGWSLGGMQSLQWGVQYPQQVERVAAWCSGTRCYPHNLLFLLGLKAALEADPHSRHAGKPVDGLRAFARVYASRAYGPGFLRDQLYRELGFASLEELLQWWEQDHLAMDHHDLLCVLDMWCRADICDFPGAAQHRQDALARLAMPVLMMPSTSDQYFLVEEAQQDAGLMPGARFQVMVSEWGHCAGGPGREAAAMVQLWEALRTLLVTSVAR